MKKQENKQILKTNMSTGSNEYKKLIILIVIITTVFLLFYILTLLFTKKDNDSIFKNDLNPSEIQYDEIIIGSMFDKDGEYYVLMLEEKDPYKELFNSYVSTIRTNGKKIYTVDLGSAFNKKYISDEYSYERENFKTKGTLLIRINDNEVKDYYESKEEILNKLKKLNEG